MLYVIGLLWQHVTHLRNTTPEVRAQEVAALLAEIDRQCSFALSL